MLPTRSDATLLVCFLLAIDAGSSLRPGRQMCYLSRVRILTDSTDMLMHGQTPHEKYKHTPRAGVIRVPLFLQTQTQITI